MAKKLPRFYAQPRYSGQGGYSKYAVFDRKVGSSQEAFTVESRDIGVVDNLLRAMNDPEIVKKLPPTR